MKKDKEQPIIIINKKRAHAGHHGGAWKVAFADFMTAMFAMFLVLWLINQSSDVKSAIAGYFQDPLGRADEFGSSILPGEGAQTQGVRRPMITEDVLQLRVDRLTKVAEDIQAFFAISPDFAELGEHLEITLTEDGLQIELIEGDEGFFFQGGAATPSAMGQKILALLGQELGSIDLPVRIEGHTDAHPFPQQDYTNWELSADRANAARRIMIGNGLGPDQIVQVRAFADRALRDPSAPFSPRNRRVTIMMLLDGVTPEGS